VRLLLDTYSLLWFVEDDPQMPAHVKDLIEYDGHEKYVSIASIRELAIKDGLGKLTLSSNELLQRRKELIQFR